MSPNESAAPKRPHEDSPLKKQFDGELGSLVAWMEDTEQKLLSSQEPTPDDPNLEEQMTNYSVSYFIYKLSFKSNLQFALTTELTSQTGKSSDLIISMLLI